MAAHMTVSSMLASFLPRFSRPAVSIASTSTALYTRQLTHPLLPTWALTVPASIQLNFPTWLGDIWESVLRAVPKKKTSHMKKRHRQMAGKALKDVTALNRCPACGHIKRAHVLCPYCVEEIKQMQKASKRAADAADSKDGPGVGA